MEEGEEKERARTVKRLIAKGYSTDHIADLLELSVEELEAIVGDS